MNSAELGLHCCQGPNSEKFNSRRTEDGIGTTPPPLPRTLLQRPIRHPSGTGMVGSMGRRAPYSLSIQRKVPFCIH